MIIIFFFLYSVLSYTFVIHGENTTTIEQDSILSSKFSLTNPIQTQCSPIRLYIVGSTQNQSEFIVKNNNETDLHFQFNITSVDSDIISVHHNKQLEKITIKPNNSFEFHVNYICLKQIGEQTWTTIQIMYQFNENQHIAYYYKFCGASETFFHPLAVLLFFSLCIIVSGSIYGIKEWKLFGGSQTEAYGPKAAIIFIIVSSFLLISLYKFQTFASSFTYIIMMFTAFISIETILLDMQNEYSYSNNIKILFSTIMSGTLIILYHHTKTWILNNILAVSIIFFSFRILEFDSLKTGTIFMLLALLYDMFWIFVSPTIFGQSVIQNITTTIELPIKLLSPSLIKNCNSPYQQCSILGIGDILIVGLIIKYILKFEKLSGENSLIFFSSILGYGIGLTSYFILIYFYHIQYPALFYIIPTTFLSIVVPSTLKSLFLQIWNGTFVIQLIEEQELEMI
ncbi:unnamed protein product (macronuclear) [Paramecium tetraurelia]|uniref:Signal peptide peptidase family protein n=1 Tax=Paramecium tetraurelia TaxID=5888 RepID=A0BI84_PARTE|nr:uncharacterized protein GSPATT00029287001 [Paramecium tetraurelia]CAK58251.1 unnamed protein product [Paramecium tetraurelia]|eukprot:XP_001425649.1 hypothetical protein (macronuclear) [Paramecium tetraurelia strain d4-2]